MNLLAMCRRLRQEASIPGAVTTVAGQQGEAQRVIDWIATAWTDIQGEREDWRFLRKSFGPTPLAIGASSFSAPSDWMQWRKDTFRYYETDVGIATEQFMVEWEYEAFRDTYRFANQQQAPNPPQVFAEDPATGTILIPQTDRAYTVYGDYQSTPIVLSQGTDTPAIADHLHMIIVWRAIRDYACHEAAPEALAKVDMHLPGLEGAMRRKYAPELLGV